LFEGMGSISQTKTVQKKNLEKRFFYTALGTVYLSLRGG